MVTIILSKVYTIYFVISVILLLYTCIILLSYTYTIKYKNASIKKNLHLIWATYYKRSEVLITLSNNIVLISPL